MTIGAGGGGSGGLAFPDLFLETAWNPPDIASDFYDLPGVYFINRRDPRSYCNADGSQGWALPDCRTAVQHGTDIFNGHSYLAGKFFTRWSAVGKPFKSFLLVVGSDSADCTVVRPNRHPSDAPNLSVFYKNGRDELATYYTAALQKYVDLLNLQAAQGTKWNLPAAVLDNNEGMVTDLTGAFAPYDNGLATNVPAEGFWALAQADSRFATVAQFAGGVSLSSWAFGGGNNPRRKLLNGVTIPAATNGNPYDPTRTDQQATATEAAVRAAIEALSIGIGAPVAAKLGCPYGTWGGTSMYARSRASPVMWRPTQYFYNLDGDFPLTAQVIDNYSTPPSFRTDAGFAGYADKRWECPANWLAAAIADGCPIPGGASAYEKYIRASTWFQKKRALAAHTAAPDAAFWVSIATDHDPNGQASFPGDWPDVEADAQQAVRDDAMVDYLLFCAQNCNLAGVWYFSPGYDTNATMRSRIQNFVRKAQAAFAAAGSSGGSTMTIALRRRALLARVAATRQTVGRVAVRSKGRRR